MRYLGLGLDSYKEVDALDEKVHKVQLARSDICAHTLERARI